MVLTEQWAEGGRLVVVDESGDRQAVLVATPRGADASAQDEQAAFSPDGRWVAFVSTRGSAHGRPRLWLVAAEVGAEPVALTDDRGRDQSPAWAPDGSLVYASDRAGTFDLYRQALVDGRAAGPAVRLTDDPGQELAPTVAADGRIAVQAIEPGLAPRSYLALVEDGALVPLTDGPIDATPAWSPDGRRLAFATRSLAGGDAELAAIVPGRARLPVRLAELPTTDEAGPVWSADGRWLFATSVATTPDGEPRWSSVIAIDLAVRGAPVRMLRDRVGGIVRAQPAVAPGPLDDALLRHAPDYLPALGVALDELDRLESARP